MKARAIIAGGRASEAPAFLAAVGIGALIALSRLLLVETLGANAPFILAWPGILIAAYVGGFWPAVIVSLVGLAVGQYVITTAGKPPFGPGAAAIFLVFGLVFAVAGQMRKQGLRRAKEYADRLAATQSQMMQLARLNAMGEMAGSLTHELNQPLTAIANYLGAAQQLLAREGAEARVDQLIGKASDQALRASQIVARLRANVDRGAIDASEESLSSLVREAVDIATVADGKAGLNIRYDFDRTDDLVLADRIQVQQVVLNLVRNAIEAMATSSRRELRIGSGADEPGFIHCFVADSGPGIAPEVAARLFQPFVTDKPTGMGVGLSISRNIIEAHGGRIWAEAGADGGAAFHFSLRRAASGAAAP